MLYLLLNSMYMCLISSRNIFTSRNQDSKRMPFCVICFYSFSLKNIVSIVRRVEAHILNGS